MREKERGREDSLNLINWLTLQSLTHQAYWINPFFILFEKGDKLMSFISNLIAI